MVCSLPAPGASPGEHRVVDAWPQRGAGGQDPAPPRGELAQGHGWGYVCHVSLLRFSSLGQPRSLSPGRAIWSIFWNRFGHRVMNHTYILLLPTEIATVEISLCLGYYSWARQEQELAQAACWGLRQPRLRHKGCASTCFLTSPSTCNLDYRSVHLCVVIYED